MKFKVGDKVKTTFQERVEGVIGEISKEYYYIWQNTNKGSVGSIKPKGFTYSWAVPFEKEDTIALIKRASGKAFMAKFLLKYDLDTDPIEEFETMKEVNDRIKELVLRSDLKRDSMVVYEIKSKKNVKIDTTISLKAA